jgi:hypothetical protein
VSLAGPCRKQFLREYTRNKSGSQNRLRLTIKMKCEKVCWLAEAGRVRHSVAAATSLWQRCMSVNGVQPYHSEILQEAFCKMSYSPFPGNRDLSDGTNAHLNVHIPQPTEQCSYRIHLLFQNKRHHRFNG